MKCVIPPTSMYFEFISKYINRMIIMAYILYVTYIYILPMVFAVGYFMVHKLTHITDK